jgi:CHAT domain-containing protein
MEQFYRSLNEGSTKTEALRLAKLSMIEGDAPALRHPYYWAPFVLIGENE